MSEGFLKKVAGFHKLATLLIKIYLQLSQFLKEKDCGSYMPSQVVWSQIQNIFC